MSLPKLTPESLSSKTILPAKGNPANVTETALPWGTYINENNWTSDQIEQFKNAASKQVAYTYKHLGGDALEVELDECQVYAAYEDAVLTYSRMVLMGQARNTMSEFLGSAKGTFDENGQLNNIDEDGVRRDANQAYPRFKFGYARQIAKAIAVEANSGGDVPLYTSYVDTENEKQTYNLEEAILKDPKFKNVEPGKEIIIKKVYYKTRRATWDLYAFYGGLMGYGGTSGVGGFGGGFGGGYGAYADSSTFEIIPTWQMKAQGSLYKDFLKVRSSGYAYDIHDNFLRIYPAPRNGYNRRVYFDFIFDESPTDSQTIVMDNGDVFLKESAGTTGVSGLNNLPFENLPFDSINSIGKHWITRYALSLSKEMLGLTRSKFDRIPFLNNNDLTLNGRDLISQAKEEMKELVDELKDILKELNYSSLLREDKEKIENAKESLSNVPMPIFRL